MQAKSMGQQRNAVAGRSAGGRRGPVEPVGQVRQVTCRAALALGLAAAALLAGCAGTPAAPDWVGGASVRYPTADYLLGRGNAPRVEQAQERARADLAKAFEFRVVARSEDVQGFSRDGEATSSKARVESRVASSTDQVVSGVRIAELWQDPGTREQHALAILPRLPAANALRQDVAAVDAAIARAIDQSRAGSDPLRRAGAAMRAVALSAQRDELQRSLRIVDITGRGVEAAVSSERLRVDAQALLQQLRIAPRGEGGIAEVGELLAGALAHAGFTVSEATPDLILRGTLQIDDQGRADGWFWLRGQVAITLADAASGEVRGRQAWTVKASAGEAETARVRLLREVDAVLRRELRATLTGFAD